MRTPPIKITLAMVLASLALSACGTLGSTTSTGGASNPTAAASGPTTTSTSTTASQTATQSATSSATATTTSAATSTPMSASTTSTTTSAAAGSGTECRASGLALSYLGGQGATGHGLLGFEVRNTQGTSCNTFGYPGVQFLDKSGAPLPTSATRTTDDFFGHSPLGQVVVDPGQTASFRLGVTHGAASEAGCTTAYGLQVIPPNDTATLTVSIPGGVLECGTATVSPMQPGTSAYH